MRLFSRILLLAVVIRVAPGAAAQGPTTGAIDGTVEDQSHGALPGVTLEAQSVSLQGVRSTQTDAAGRYRFPSLPPGIYRLSARLPGFSPVDEADIRVSLAATASVPLTMHLSVSTEIEVNGEPPLLEVTSATGGENVREDVIRKLPVGRNYAEIIRIDPSVATDNAATQARAIPFTIYGSTSLENQYLVDGANTTNVIKGFEGKALPNEFIEEVQIKSSGYEVEYGRATGGIINVVTKSGGNDVHGDAFGYFDTKGLTASSKATAATDANFVDSSSKNRRDYGADIGGPIARDRLWFFGAYNRVDVGQDQVPLAGTGLPNAGVNFPLDYALNVYSAKLTLRAADSTTLVGTVFGDPERREGTLTNFTASDPIFQQGTREVGGTDYTFSVMQLLGAAGLVNARYAHHRDRFSLTPKANTVRLSDFTENPDNPTVSGGFGFVGGPTQNNTSTRDAFKLDGTFFAGSHEIKAGIDYEKNFTDATTYATGGQTVDKRLCPAGDAELVCPAGETVYYVHSFFTASRTDPVGAALPGGVTVSPHTNRLGIFVQDSFKVLPNLTVNAGLRYDEDDVRDYANQGIFLLSGEWQPRVGLAWDVTKDGTSRVSASLGRFYYALPTDLSVIAFGNRIFANTYNFSPADLAEDPAAPFPERVFGGLQSEPVQERIKGVYIDEVTIGFDKALDPTLVVGIRYTYRNLGRAIEDRCDLDPGYPEARDNNCVLINPGSDSPFATGAGIHGCSGRDDLGTEGNPPESQCISPATYPVDPIPAARRQYNGLELVARKQVKNKLFLQASYLYSRLRGNYDGAANISFTGQSDPGITEDFDYAALVVNADGKLNLDRPHSFRLDTAYTTPFGVTVGLQAFLRSGAPISKRGILGTSNTFYYQFLTPRGSEGRQPWDYEVNLSLQYAFKVGPLTVTAFGQGFNLLNRQTVLNTDQIVTLNPPTYPDYLNPDYGKSIERRDPRAFRFGARVSF